MSMETEQAESIKKLSEEVNNLSQVVVKIKDCLIETNNSTKTIKIILIFWFILGLVPLAIFLFFFSYFQSRFQF
jgi:type II secretory pathway component PulF